MVGFFLEGCEKVEMIKVVFGNFREGKVRKSGRVIRIWEGRGIFKLRVCNEEGLNIFLLSFVYFIF